MGMILAILLVSARAVMGVTWKQQAVMERVVHLILRPLEQLVRGARAVRQVKELWLRSCL